MYPSRRITVDGYPDNYLAVPLADAIVVVQKALGEWDGHGAYLHSVLYERRDTIIKELQAQAKPMIGYGGVEEAPPLFIVDDE
jgi:hypothetical protein